MKIAHTGVLGNERYLKNAIYSMSNVKHFHLTTFVRICLETFNAFLMVSFLIYLLVHKTEKELATHDEIQTGEKDKFAHVFVGKIKTPSTDCERQKAELFTTKKLSK